MGVDELKRSDQAVWTIHIRFSWQGQTRPHRHGKCPYIYQLQQGLGFYQGAWGEPMEFKRAKVKSKSKTSEGLPARNVALGERWMTIKDKEFVPLLCESLESRSNLGLRGSTGHTKGSIMIRLRKRKNKCQQAYHKYPAPHILLQILLCARSIQIWS